jgi:hypothetical protein
MTLITTYQNNNGAGSIEGGFGMQVDSANKLIFISAATDKYLTILNYSNSSSIIRWGNGYTDSSPPQSIDGILRGFLNTTEKVFFAPSAVDSATSWFNVTTSTITFLGNTTADTSGSGSQEGEYDVIEVFTNGNRWLVTGGTTDSYITTFLINTLAARPTVNTSITDTSGACSITGMRDLYNIPGTAYVLVAATGADYLTVETIGTNGAITCASSYTDADGANSIDGLQDLKYEPSTKLVYTTSPIDGYMSIINLTVPTSTPVAVGSVGGLTAPISVSNPITIGSDKFVFVGSSTAAQNITAINVTDPTNPTIYSIFNQTSGTCVYNVVNDLYAEGNYLYAISGTDSCFYVIELGAFSTVCSGTPNGCGTYNASQTNCERVSCDWNNEEIMVNDTWTEMTGATNWSNVTKVVNSNADKTIKWCVYANDTSNNWNGTSCSAPFSYVTTAGGDTCDCSSIQAGTSINCAENCDIGACNVGGIAVTFINTGTITTSEDVTNILRTTWANGCKVIIGSGKRYG